MGAEKIVPTEKELKNLDLSDPGIVELVHYAQQSDAADRLLTVGQALKKYKKAVFWAMFLSTSLIMEGYDLVIVRIPSMPMFPFLRCCRIGQVTLTIFNADQLILRPIAISE
jgi:hypothetical protein